MPDPDDSIALDAIRRAAIPLGGDPADWDALLEQTADARFVLLGEASHGTHDFYHARAVITRRLIQEQGFDAVAVEADWPDAYRVNRYVRGLGEDTGAPEALADFTRFPTWMWRNTDVLAFVRWLRGHNATRPARERVGFYGLDLYSLYRSVDRVVDYLAEVDPEAAARARRRYGCLDHGGDEAQSYGMGVSLGMRPDCEDEVVRQLMDLQQRGTEYLLADGLLAEDEHFQAEQNARVVANAERYYRAMFGAQENTWNLRDTHMADTLDALARHLGRERPARIVVWEHNSHLGDARATARSRFGEINVGQLVRERHGREALAVGFTTDTGHVAAASDWDGPVEHKRVRPALPGSYEALFRDAGVGRFLLPLGEPTIAQALAGPRLERAIGVIYLPATERASHYFHCTLPRQFDLVAHFDETRAVRPLDPVSEWEAAVPETYPFGE